MLRWQSIRKRLKASAIYGGDIEQFRQKLGNAITSVCGGTVYVLSQNYYSRNWCFRRTAGNGIYKL